MDSALQIDVLVLEGCPHAEGALALAQRVRDRLAPGATVQRIAINTPEAAAASGFLGSPSIRVGGIDVEGKHTTRGALSCRVYDGGVGLPPEWLVEAAVLRAVAPQGILFLCVANSARSQMAEGIARFLLPASTRVWSAGSRPTQVRPEAVAVLREIGIDMSGQRAKLVSEIPADDVDVVVTLCGEEQCPVFLGQALRVHWGLSDPAAVTGSDAARMAAFRRIRDELRRRLQALVGIDGGAAVTG